ncbi:MAG: HAD hydrolase-like protein [Arthrobacter sp.]|nr:HAD hydrolase-like protein [Arthrobacter sp.]
MVIPSTRQYPRAVLFDLDGTLVDPAGGITRGIEHGLVANALPVPDQAVLDELVGPPLAIGLEELAGVPAESIPAVVRDYRAWYRERGIALSRVYPGVTEALAALKDAGVRLAVVTSKPTPLARTLLAHHGLDSLFEVIVGTSADETAAPAPGGAKDHLLREAADALGVQPAECTMVGDRRFDILAAKATGARSLGAGWGFAPANELAQAGADAEIAAPHELRGALLLTEEA